MKSIIERFHCGIDRDSVYMYVHDCIYPIPYRTYDPVEAVVLPDKAGKIYKMEPSEKGIWVTFKK